MYILGALVSEGDIGSKYATGPEVYFAGARGEKFWTPTRSEAKDFATIGDLLIDVGKIALALGYEIPADGNQDGYFIEQVNTGNRFRV